MLRNTVENAVSFAVKKVRIEVWAEGNRLLISIQDDGKGFTVDALEAFGTRRMTRYLGSNDDGSRLSVGLGSVIIKTIAEAHHGSVKVKNQMGPSGQVLGACVIIALPLS